MKCQRYLGYFMEGAVILIIVNGSDIASTNQADRLLELSQWNKLSDVESKTAYSLQDVRMWIIPQGVLFEDNLEKS